MKNLILTLMFSMIFSILPACATDNNLNSVVLEGTEAGYNVILRADKVTKLKKTVTDENTLIIDLKNTTTSDSVDTRYINTKDVNNVVVEAKNNEVKIYIQAKNINNSNIIFDTPASAPVVVGDSLSKKAMGWTAFAFVLLCLILSSFKKSNEEEDVSALKEDLKDREIRLYKNYKMEVLNAAKIDYRLKQQYLKRNGAHAETIRHLQKLTMR